MNHYIYRGKLRDFDEYIKTVNIADKKNDEDSEGEGASRTSLDGGENEYEYLGYAMFKKCKLEEKKTS